MRPGRRRRDHTPHAPYVSLKREVTVFTNGVAAGEVDVDLVGCRCAFGRRRDEGARQHRDSGSIEERQSKSGLVCGPWSQSVGCGGGLRVGRSAAGPGDGFGESWAMCNDVAFSASTVAALRTLQHVSADEAEPESEHSPALTKGSGRRARGKSSSSTLGAAISALSCRASPSPRLRYS